MKTTDLDEKYQSSYNEEATEYDQARFGSVRGDFAMRYKNALAIELLKQFGALHEEARLLDCPSGTGRLCHALANESFAHIDAVDISQEMLNVNKEKLPMDPDKVTFTVCNMKELPFEDDTFDGVVMPSFFYLVPLDEYPEYIADIHRVLKPGGVVIAECSNAFPACNPINLLKVLKQKYVDKQAVKSYVPFWRLRGAYTPFEIALVKGAEYPLIGKKYEGYAKLCRTFGSLPLFRSVGGKFTIVLRKREE